VVVAGAGALGVDEPAGVGETAVADGADGADVAAGVADVLAGVGPVGRGALGVVGTVVGGVGFGFVGTDVGAVVGATVGAGVEAFGFPGVRACPGAAGWAAAGGPGTCGIGWAPASGALRRIQDANRTAPPGTTGFLPSRRWAAISESRVD
jgi:hypothetical protein